MRATSELLSEIVGDAADVSAFGASDAEFADRLLVAAESEIVDMNEARLAIDFDAFPRQFVQRNALDFDRRDHRRRLKLVADERARGFVELLKCQRWNGQR